eukprot:12573542-Heterocapsa_arctica.AAC.1
MIVKAKLLEANIRTEHPETPERILVKLVQQAIGKHLPTLNSPKKVKKLMVQEETLQNIMN